MFVPDTHSWLWHLSSDPRLGDKAREIFEKVDDGEEKILLPTIVIVESIYITEKRGYSIEMKGVVEDLTFSSNYLVREIDLSILSALARDDRELSIHDKIIVLTAEQEGAPILSMDDEITKNAEEEVLW